MLGTVFQQRKRRSKRIQKKTLEDQVAKLKLDSTPRLGAANAPFKVTVFSDFQCPYCSKIAPILHNLKDLADGKVALYFKHFPLGFHRRAKPAAVASYCAHKQGKFWDFHDAIFATPRALADADLEGHAKKLGLNLDDYRTCVSSREASVSVDDDMAEGKGASVTGTPTILVNGRKYNGGRSPEAMLDAIEKLEQGAL
jgi:protein-disulfide isomerase